MTAAVENAEADVHQLPLAPEPEPVHHAVWGRLSRQAEVRVATDGSHRLVVQIRCLCIYQFIR